MQLPPHLCPYRDCNLYLPGTASAVLSGSARVGAGPHYVMIAITRVYPSASDPTSPALYQFLDNVTVTWTGTDGR